MSIRKSDAADFDGKAVAAALPLAPGVYRMLNADDGVLVEGILSVARHFGLRVVAEGVETQAQADFLSQRAPEIVYQGYLFGRPEPDADWLARAALAGTATVEDEG